MTAAFSAVLLMLTTNAVEYTSTCPYLPAQNSAANITEQWNDLSSDLMTLLKQRRESRVQQDVGPAVAEKPQPVEEFTGPAVAERRPVVEDVVPEVAPVEEAPVEFTGPAVAERLPREVPQVISPDDISLVAAAWPNLSAEAKAEILQIIQARTAK